MRQTGRQIDTVPCCPTFSSSSSIYELLPAASGHVKLWPISLHLLEGWPGKPTTLLCFGSQSHAYRHTNHRLCVSDCLMQSKSAFSLPLQTYVPVLMHFYKKGGQLLNVFDLHAVGFTTDNHCQQALWHERVCMSPLPVLRHSSASYNRVSWWF